MRHIEELKGVIRAVHGAEATHRESVPVKEVFRGQTVWEGTVEVFDLHGHTETKTAYAWSHATEDPDSPRRYVTVLHVHPVVSPLAAVRASIVQEFRSRESA